MIDSLVKHRLLVVHLHACIYAHISGSNELLCCNKQSWIYFCQIFVQDVYIYLCV